MYGQEITVSDPKVAVVTGGTRGIGYGISTVLASQQYMLVLGYNSNHDAAKQAKEELEAQYGVRVVTVCGDISVPATLIALFQAVKDHFDDVCTAFIHNAGLYVGVTTTSAEAPVRLNPDEPWEDRVYDYYQKVYPRAFRKGLELALQCKGLQHVIAISSPGCNCNQPAMPGYEEPGQAKSSMEFLVRVFAKKLAKDGINVNCIIPGFIRTGAWENVFKGKDDMRKLVEERVRKDTPAQRWAEPREIGEVAAFLCSEKASFLTGVAIPVDGGLHLGKLQ